MAQHRLHPNMTSTDGVENPSLEYLAHVGRSNMATPRQQTSKDTNDHLLLPNGQPHKSTTGIISEHGHSLDHIDPMSVHSGSSVVTFFTGLFQTILAISTLGASITFSYVLSNTNVTSGSNSPISTPNNPTPRFSTATIQLFLSISWLLFLLNLAFASLGSTLLTFFKDHWKEDWDGANGRTSQLTVQWYAVLASITMGGLVIGAFLLLCLVVVAYSPVVGWIALAFTTVFGLIILVSIGWQVPWNGPRLQQSGVARAATT